jgi:DNA-binding winged helix-turn-helix (wHTH) protein
MSSGIEQSSTASLRIGEWTIDPLHSLMTRQGETVRLETRTLRLLLCLAERAGEVVSVDELLNEVWPGVIVTPDSVYQAVTALRRQLGDNPRQPAYIATVPRRGYRLVATVDSGDASTSLPSPVQTATNDVREPPHAMPRRGIYPRLLAMAALLALACLRSTCLDGRSRHRPRPRWPTPGRWR